MKPEERYCQEDFDSARDMIRNCPIECLLVFDPESNRVFYRNALGDILTEFTEDHIEISWHVFPKWGEDHINIDPVDPAQVR